MTDTTEQKILDAALKEFAQNGYTGATTMTIAKRAGFSEKTLFRKFKTKQNLFDTVLLHNNMKMKEDFDAILIVNKFESPRDFLEYFVKSAAKWYDDHFEVYHLSLSEDNKMLEPVMNEFFNVTTIYFKNNLPSKKIDHKTLALSISTLLYVLALEKYHGRTVIKREETIEKFIDNLMICFK